jgi:flagellar basal body-associated protein FliL
LDVPREMGKEKKKEEMKILILTGLVVIIILLAFIAVMIWGIGEHLSHK